MNRRCMLASCCLATTVVLAATWATIGADAVAPAVPPPDVVGDWTGDWGPFDPAKGEVLDKQKCKRLDCRVVASGDVWQATFEGECGRPYTYTIRMEGRQAGPVVLFRGTTDLGEKDGGVYDWVGRATDKEFAGFYTSSHHVGVFRLSRSQPE